MPDSTTLILSNAYGYPTQSVLVRHGLVSRRDVMRAYRKLTPAGEPVSIRTADGRRAVLSYVDDTTYAVEVA